MDPRCKLFENLLVPLAGAKAQQTVTELELKFGSPTDHEVMRVMRVMRVICGKTFLEGNQFVNFDVFLTPKVSEAKNPLET